MKVLHVCSFAVLVLVATTFTSSSEAAQNPSQSIGDRLRGADSVVVARVESVTSQWLENEHGDRIIVSRLLLRIEESLKGDAEPVEWIEVEGGTVDGITLHVSSGTTLKADERAVFFLDRRVPGHLLTPYQKGLGVLKLDDHDVVRGSTIRLDEIRGLADNLQ